MQIKKRLFHRAPDHLIQVAADLTLIDSENFAQWLCGIFHLGGPFLFVNVVWRLQF
jgi:hypothetical protein